MSVFSYQSLKALEAAINDDKKRGGNRFPWRFVLFDDYKNFDTFIQTRRFNAFVYPLAKALSDDKLLTMKSLCDWIKGKQQLAFGKNDLVVFPISEIARFYDDHEFKCFITTIKGIESRDEQQRVYLPFIGQQSRMYNFVNDPDIVIWDNCNQNQAGNCYSLILTDDVKLNNINGLSNKYSICSSLKDWVNLWQPNNKIKHKIILSSKTASDIYKKNSLPTSDNAIDVKFYPDIKSLLSMLIDKDLSIMPPHKRDNDFWNTFSSKIDFTNNFDPLFFLRNTFNSNFSNLEADVLANWLKCPDSYSRWLLKWLYLLIPKKKGHLF